MVALLCSQGLPPKKGSKTVKSNFIVNVSFFLLFVFFVSCLLVVCVGLFILSQLNKNLIMYFRQLLVHVSSLVENFLCIIVSPS